MIWPMGRRQKSEQATQSTPTPSEQPDNVGARMWWVKGDNKDFKKEILGLTYEQCQELSGKIQEWIKKTTLRPYVEALSDAEQKLAARFAPIHRGRHEALLSRMHSIVRPNPQAE